MVPSVIRVGLIGHGTVGGAFARALQARTDSITERTGLKLALAQIATRTPGARSPLPFAGRVHGDAATLADDPSIDIVVEASGAPDAAQWIRRALARGASVVTANKQALARDPILLAALARHEPRLHCEASVAAAIPIVRAVRESLEGEEVLSVRGVLNGTTTYILSRLEAGRPFAEALEDAKREGYTESDASYDLSGSDAAAKLAILCTLAWCVPVTRAQIDTRGIDESIVETVARASARGARVRLVATASRNGTLVARVEPEILMPGDPLASATGVHNVVELRTSLAGTLTLYGQGAGGGGTASALLGDTISAARSIARSRLSRLAS